MLVKQVSAFIENKAGRLCEAADKIAEKGIDISALSLADSAEYGVLRMIVSDPEKTGETLREDGVICKVTTVLAVAMDDTPGGFAGVLNTLTEAGIEIKYIYACISRISGKALMIFSVENPEIADELIASTEAGKVDPSEVYRI